MSKLNQQAQQIHLANIKWWQDPLTHKPITRNCFELLALAVSEVSEALEGERKNIMDDKLPHRKMAEVEMADTYIRLLDFSCGFNYVLYEEKLLDKIPDNKGEALYNLMDYIIKCGNSTTSAWLSLSIAYIRAYCQKWNYDLDGAITEKLIYNSTREDHKHEARLIAGGKQF